MSDFLKDGLSGLRLGLEGALNLQDNIKKEMNPAQKGLADSFMKELIELTKKGDIKGAEELKKNFIKRANELND